MGGFEQSTKPKNIPSEEQIQQERRESLERAKKAQKNAGHRLIKARKKQQPTKGVTGAEGEVDLSEEAKEIFEGEGQK